MFGGAQLGGMAPEMTTSNITWNGILDIRLTVPDYNAA